MCKLCGGPGPLLLSHIIPAFAFRWMRDSAGGGHLRGSNQPNLRVQDGVKRYMLCASCEELFSRSEKSFADKLFYPYLKDPTGRFAYSDWLLRFCVSVSWRVLALALAEGEWSDDANLRDAVEAEQVWRSYLLDGRPNPGVFRQHVVPVDQIRTSAAHLSPNINRYLMRAIHMDLGINSRSMFTFVKLGRFIIIGTVRERDPRHWRGTKIHATHGVVEPTTYHLPGALGRYINEKAAELHGAIDSISDRQKGKIQEALLANAADYLGSDAFTAMQADVERYGDKAF